MQLAIGIVVLVAGLICVTPAGARLSMRMNKSQYADRGGYKPKTINGMRAVGVLVTAAGAVIVVQSL